VRKVIHAFNEEGFGSLDPDYRGGRPRKTAPEQRDRIIAVARARPDTLGVALTRWSLAKLADHRPNGRRAVRGGAASDTQGRGALASAHPLVEVEPGPDFAQKAERVLGLYRHKPADGVVVCFDEMGPIGLIPHHGSGWAPAKRPSVCARRTPSPTGCATCSAPSTSTPTACTAGCARTRTPSKCSASTARSGCATPAGCGST
jgi:hypothetical protein